MTPEQINALKQPFPESALSVKKISGKEFTYIDHAAVTRRLIEVTGGNYSFEIVDSTFLPWGSNDKGEIRAHLVHGRIRIGSDSWDGHGVALIYAGAGEDLLKAAESDAFKKACTRIGVGLELYGQDIEGELKAVATHLGSAELMSMEQKGLLIGLVKRLGWTVKDNKGHEHHDSRRLKEWLIKNYQHDIDELTKEEATNAIERFTAQVDKRQEAA